MITAQQLYQPDKFKVYLGEGLNIGFCTVWNEPQATLKQAPELNQKCAILGTLYGRQGVSIIIRNLALNPQIRHLYIWGNGPLSNTKFGKTGTEVLFALWKNGVANDNIVNDTNFKLEKEIDPAVVQKIITQVELVDLSEKSLTEAVALIDNKTSEPYMESVRFPDAIPEAPEKFPSETIGWMVRGPSIIDAWLKVVQRIMFYGTVKGTQYGMPQRELINVTWVVSEEDPDSPRLPQDWPQELRDLTGADENALKEYFPIILSPEAQPGTSYTYGNRLKSFPTKNGPLDQIKDVIIKQLKNSPDARRTVATTMAPELDWNSSEPPCLTQIQCLQSDGSLHLLATFRSHDIFKAAIANAFGLRKLQQELVAELGFQMGSLAITSQSAHIYEADFAHARKITACAFMEREPNLVFQAENADPRGNLIILVKPETKIIEIILMGPDGGELWKYAGASSRHIQAKLGQLDLISKTDHALDIGMELQKAQIALDKNLVYTQDRPLKF